MLILSHAKKFTRVVSRVVCPTYEQLLQGMVSDCDSILDLGCGANSPVGRLKRKPFSVGIDQHRPSLDTSQSRGLHHEYKCIDILEAGRHFTPGSFDCVIACDVIEHLEKSDGYKLIEVMEQLARRRVIIFTPNGFLPQQDEDNPWNIHRSGWTVDEMSARGYKSLGINGWKPLRGEFGIPRIKPRWLGHN